MNRVVRTILIASALALPLGGCGSMPDVPNFDPADWISGDIFGTKKPLPGERKALFPEGVPGVARGVPQDLVKGNQPPPGAEGSGIAQEASLLAEEPKPKPKPKAKPKPKVAAKPAPVAPTSTPTSVTVRRYGSAAAAAATAAATGRGAVARPAASAAPGSRRHSVARPAAANCARRSGAA